MQDLQRSYFKERGQAVPFRAREDATILGMIQMPSNKNKSNRRHVDEMNETSFQEQSEEEQDLFDSLRCIPSSMDPRPSRQNQNPASNKRIRSDSLEMTYIPDDQVIVRGPEHFAREDPNLALHFKPSKGDLQKAIDQYSIADCIFVVEFFFSVFRRTNL